MFERLVSQHSSVGCVNVNVNVRGDRENPGSVRLVKIDI
jgi:hypothetical protein